MAGINQHGQNVNYRYRRSNHHLIIIVLGRVGPVVLGSWGGTLPVSINIQTQLWIKHFARKTSLKTQLSQRWWRRKLKIWQQLPPAMSAVTTTVRCQNGLSGPIVTMKNVYHKQPVIEYLITFWSVLSSHFHFSWCEKTQQTHCPGRKGSPWKMLSSSLGDRVRLRTALWFNFHKYSFQAMSCLSVLSIPVGGERWRCFLPAVGWPQGWK